MCLDGLEGKANEKAYAIEGCEFLFESGSCFDGTCGGMRTDHWLRQCMFTFS